VLHFLAWHIFQMQLRDHYYQFYLLPPPDEVRDELPPDEVPPELREAPPPLDTDDPPDEPRDGGGLDTVGLLLPPDEGRLTEGVLLVAGAVRTEELPERLSGRL
jgi:hypothetical protein